MIRIKHWRGHGIHSPFVYRFVREAVMKGCEAKSLPVDILPGRDRCFLERLYAYLGYDDCIIAGEGAPADKTLCIVPRGASPEAVEKLAAEMDRRRGKCCLAVLGVNKSHDMRKLCRQITKRADCVSVDSRRRYIFFFDSGLYKQHYRI